MTGSVLHKHPGSRRFSITKIVTHFFFLLFEAPRLYKGSSTVSKTTTQRNGGRQSLAQTPCRKKILNLFSFVHSGVHRLHKKEVLPSKKQHNVTVTGSVLHKHPGSKRFSISKNVTHIFFLLFEAPRLHKRSSTVSKTTTQRNGGRQSLAQTPWLKKIQNVFSFCVF